MAKKRIDMGDSGYDPLGWEAYRWCVRNNIAISAKARGPAQWYVVIENKGKINQSPETYGKTVIWIKIFEYCKYYFNKITNENYTK